ncbi:MAG: SDR family oxidoreductase [Verrucomicrobia bacterium]|nr:SDR family oxidoreductase [Verrucomicrobiota bacterium]
MKTDRLADKIAVVTGASQGIGEAIAKDLAQNGAKVILAARDAQKLGEAVATIRETGGEGLAYPADLRELDAPQRLVEAAVGQFGGIDIVVNNAGATRRGAFLTLNEEAWQDSFALKFFGSVRLVRAAWLHLKTRSGSIVNIAGVGGRTPGAEFAIGGSVNAALLSFTKAIAELGVEEGIQVNAINPGFIRTDRLKRRLEASAASLGVTVIEAERVMVRDAQVSRLGEPEDIAHLVTFVVSPEGRFLHGSLIDMDGGQTKTI